MLYLFSTQRHASAVYALAIQFARDTHGRCLIAV